MIIYQGVFLDEDAIKHLQAKEGEGLERKVSDMHVTFEFRPTDSLPSEMIGREIDIKVVGYGKDEHNVGFHVEIPEEYREYYNGASIPHITTSLSLTGKPVNTANLLFVPIQPFIVKGRFGYFDGSKVVI